MSYFIIVGLLVALPPPETPEIPVILCGYVDPGFRCCVSQPGSYGCQCIGGDCVDMFGNPPQAGIFCFSHNWGYTKHPQGDVLDIVMKRCMETKVCHKSIPFAPCSSNFPCVITTDTIYAEAYFSTHWPCDKID